MGALLAALAPAATEAADVSGVAAVDVSGVSADAILPPPTPLTASQALYLDVSLNSTPRGLLPFTENRGRLQASPEVLRQLGFNASGDAPVYLDQISGAVVRYDAHMQTLALDVPLDQLTLPTTVLSRPQARAPTGSASPGVLLNYDVYGSRVDTLGNLSLSSELRVFGIGNGTFENTAISRRYQQPGDRRWRGESVRLDTRWSLDFPDSATTLEVGDFYSGFVDWTRPVRLGGLQIGRNYGLQPYRVLTPTPSFLGQAVVPSTVELYVDGLRQYSGQVPVGPFQLAAQPGISGTGNAQVVVTDAFGRMQTLDFSFYGTQQLLARGLSDWSAGVGHLREDFGQRSFAYDDRTVASASWRGGVTDTFTGEAHAEGGGGLAQAGVGGWWLLGAAGVFNAAYAHSGYHGLQGGQWALGYSWNNRRFIGRYSFGASRQGGLNYAYASASGSLVWMGGHAFATREVSDAFAVISTNGVGGVPVRLENRLIGVTDDRGLLLVSPLLSWQRNRVSIDTLDLPEDMRADRIEDWVTPRQRAGTRVTFQLRSRPSLSLTLLAMDGQPLEVGSEVRLPDGRQATVGYDGLLYLEDVAAGSVLYVTTSRGPCRVKVPDLPKVVASGARPKPAPQQCIPEVAP